MSKYWKNRQADSTQTSQLKSLPITIRHSLKKMLLSLRYCSSQTKKEPHSFIKHSVRISRKLFSLVSFVKVKKSLHQNIKLRSFHQLWSLRPMAKAFSITSQNSIMEESLISLTSTHKFLLIHHLRTIKSNKAQLLNHGLLFKFPRSQKTPEMMFASRRMELSA